MKIYERVYIHATAYARAGDHSRGKFIRSPRGVARGKKQPTAVQTDIALVKARLRPLLSHNDALINPLLRLSAAKQEDIPTCVVNGKTYKEGEYFKAEEDPEMTCICQPGYEGNENALMSLMR